MSAGAYPFDYMTAQAVAQRIGVVDPNRIWPACGCGDGHDDEDPTAGTGERSTCQGPGDPRVMGRPLREDENCPCPCHGEL